MSTNLNIGIIGSVRGWNTILTQEGISFDKISFPDIIDSKKYPVLILDSIIEVKSYKSIEYYIKKGGALLISTRLWKVFFHGIGKTVGVKYLQPNNNILFPSIGLVDIYDKIEIPLDNSLTILDSTLFIFEKIIGLGKLVVYPFDLPKIMNDFRKTRKRFLDSRKELPSEIVATVSKNKIREIMISCLQHLFKFQNIPLVSLWYYPKKEETIFIFRVDTDFCPQEKSLKLFDICKKYDIPGTWFLDTSSKDMLINVYKKMSAQELALHCDVHKVYNDEKLNVKNIQNGLNKLNDAGIDIDGFAAPFGEWNPSLAKSIKAFKYSSEFSLDYDNFPYYPYIKEKISGVLQIPIHPISIGRLNRSHYSYKEMVEYYIKIFNDKLKKNEPIIIYFHPENNHFEVLENIFQWINNNKINKYSMSAFANWWNKRNTIKFCYTYSKKNKILSSTNENSGDFYLKIYYKNNYSIIKSSPEIDLRTLIWKKHETISYSKNLSRIRKFYWRDILHDYESKKARARF